MHEIKCPGCGKTFTIDEAGYADIVRQVRDENFEKELHQRLDLAEQAQVAKVELAVAKVETDTSRSITGMNSRCAISSCSSLRVSASMSDNFSIKASS